MQQVVASANAKDSVARDLDKLKEDLFPKIKRDPPKKRECIIIWEWQQGPDWIAYQPEQAKVLEKGYHKVYFFIKCHF